MKRISEFVPLTREKEREREREREREKDSETERKRGTKREGLRSNKKDKHSRYKLIVRYIDRTE